VTEAITGLDLVEQMIRVAAGEKLAFAQDDVTLNGWAIENRVYAEDPYRGFLPSTGRLVRYAPPKDTSPSRSREGLGEGLSASGFSSDEQPLSRPLPRAGGETKGYTRVDDGVAAGGEVSMFYDPMIAKLVTWAPTRDEAADLQVAALDRFVLEGVGNNIDFLSALMQHPRFREGALTTGFIAEEYPDGFTGAAVPDGMIDRLAAVAAVLDMEAVMRGATISGKLDERFVPRTERAVLIGDRRYDITIDGYEGGLLVNLDPQESPRDFVGHWRPGEPLFAVRIDDRPMTVAVKRILGGWRLTAHGRSHDVRVYSPRVADLARHMIEKIPPDLSKFLLCPMPGLLTTLHVGAGERVEAGQPLAVVEAMKMENILRAERPGVVAKVNHTPGDSLAVDAAILEFE
jgi:propionyl-CoA carboxylase alpha chain